MADDGGSSHEPLVSVLIVHHERPQLLTQAVQSIIAQEYRKVELIVVDNGSEGEHTHHMLDALEEELRKHAGRMFRIRKVPLGAGERGAQVRGGRSFCCGVRGWGDPPVSSVTLG